MNNPALHRHTPTLQVCDPSGAPVRSVAYYRRTAQEQAQPRVTASASRRAGRVSQQWDSRLFALSTALTADTANLTGLSSLSGRPLLTESVDAGWRVQFWGAAGELQVGWDGRGTRTRHTYDAMQRPIAVFEQCQDAPECCIGLTTYGTQAAASVALNQCGQPVRVDDSAGSRQVHGYSLQGAPLAETRHFLQALAEPDWPQAVAQRDALLEPEGATTRWGYDALGALLQQTDAQGNHQYTDYNIAGQIAGTRLQLRGQVEQTLIRDIAYNAFGQITAETAGNGVTTQATYRADTGVLLGLRAQRADKTWLQDLRYTYDPVGNVLSITDATQSVRHFANARIVPVNNYAYDTLSQLIRATGREVGSSGYGPELRVSADPTQLVNYTQTYHYDTAGNLHTLQHLGAQSYTRKMQAAEHSNRSLARKVNDPLLNAGEFSAGFDANGNVQHLQPGQVLLWDGRNQLCQVTPVARDEGADDTERYVYDGGGQRLRKVRISQAKNVAHIAQVRYLPGLEIREDSATGEILHVITVQSLGRSSVRVLHWVTDTPIGVSNNQLRYGLGDHLGSSSLELDSEAQLVSQEGYYPYGGTAWWAASSRTEVKYKTVRYSGKERDATGLYYYGFRYYAPCWGRWLNPDPAGTVDGLNLYRMVRSNPMSYKDSNGHSAEWYLYIYNQANASHEERLLNDRELGHLFSNGKPKIILSGDGHRSPPLAYAEDLPDLSAAGKAGKLMLYVEATQKEINDNPGGFTPEIFSKNNTGMKGWFKPNKLFGWEPEKLSSMCAGVNILNNSLVDVEPKEPEKTREELKELGARIVAEFGSDYESLGARFSEAISNIVESEGHNYEHFRVLSCLSGSTWRDEFINPYLANKITQAAKKNSRKTFVVSVGYGHLLQENNPVQNFLGEAQMNGSFTHEIIFNKDRYPTVPRPKSL